uniref:Uncharacterized protein n=1 Tax=Cacopsylla melanoneura TaxID=428564 RepID=A0A8D8YCS1_9HEMI
MRTASPRQAITPVQALTLDFSRNVPSMKPLNRSAWAYQILALPKPSLNTAPVGDPNPATMFWLTISLTLSVERIQIFPPFPKDWPIGRQAICNIALTKL